MSVVSVRLAKSLHEKLKSIASAEGISLNQYINLALTEKTAKEEADHWWRLRGGDITREEALSHLDKVDN
jgi:predicted transcriptional regulator